MQDTIGTRFYAVRLAHGDGVRTAMPLREFSALVKARTGRVIHASELSEIETGVREEIAVADVSAVADVDPLRRGRSWLAFGNDTGRLDGPADSVEAVPRPDPENGGGVKGVKHPPKKPSSLPGRRSGGKDDRPVQKKPPRR